MLARRISGKIAALAALLVLPWAAAYAADCNDGGRYEDMDDGTVQDCRTGLIWLKNANCANNFGGIDKSTGTLDWHDAMTWVAAVRDTGNPATSCGLTDGSSQGDWRLPTKTEWMAMVAYAKMKGYSPVLTNAAGTAPLADGDAFNNVQSTNFYWTSTVNPLNITQAWIVNMEAGTFFLTSSAAFVWPVRGGQSGTFGNLLIR